MHNRKIVFIGGIGSQKQFGGELTKNKEIINRFLDLEYPLSIIDTYQARKKPFKLVKLLFAIIYNCIFHSDSTFIFSTSFGNIYPLFKLFHLFFVKIRIVYWVIGGIFSQRVTKGEFKSKYLKDIDLFLVEGNKMKQELALNGYSNVSYVPNFKTIYPLPILKKWDDGKIHFYFLSRIMPEKGCDDILGAIEMLNTEGYTDKYCVDFYGNIDKSYKNRFLAALNKINNAYYKGSLLLSDENNYQKLARYHCMLFPTYWQGEGFPGVIIDAYKAGNMVIASNWNFNNEFVKDGVTGFLVPVHSKEAIAEMMKKVIWDEQTVLTMSRNCQKEALCYDTINVINEKLLNTIFYDEEVL